MTAIIRKPIALLCCLFVHVSMAAHITTAQVETDGTVGPLQTLTGPNYSIGFDLGTQYGGNLFHSFSTFSLLKGEIATFTGPATVTNVIGRVTGGETSYINGLIRSEISGANLFLVNPSGWIFGENASLDLTGSFYVSTADYLRIGDEGRFDATHPVESSFSSAPPSAFGFLSNSPSELTIKGDLIGSENDAVSVVGGDITIDGGLIQAPSGEVMLASAGSPGEICVDSGDISADSVQRHGEIVVVSDGKVDTNGEQSGDVYIRGGRLVIAQGASVQSVSMSGHGGGIHIDADESLHLLEKGSVAAASLGDGDAGDVEITSDSVRLEGGSWIDTAAQGDGNGGRIQIDAGSIVVDGHETHIQSPATGAGNSGDIYLSAGEIRIQNEGRIVSSNTGAGKSGDIHLDATSTVHLKNQGQVMAVQINNQTGSPGGTVAVRASEMMISENSRISTETANNSQSGDVQVVIGELRIESGGQIVTSSSGQPGGIDIESTGKVAITGTGAVNENTGLFLESRDSDTAKGIAVSADTLSVADGGLVSTRAEFGGTGGDISVDANRVSVGGAGAVTAIAKGDGSSGNIRITANADIRIHDGGIITTATDGSGKAGDMAIATDRLSIQSEGLIDSGGSGAGGQIGISASEIDIDQGYISSSSENDTGQRRGAGGDIIIQAESLQIKGAGNQENGPRADFYGIYSQTQGIDDGGHIRITANDVGISRDGWLNAQTYGAGKGGDISLDMATLSLTDGATMTTSSRGEGASGVIDINARESVFIGGAGAKLGMSSVYSAAHSAGPGGEITIQSPRLIVGEDGAVVSDTLGDDTQDGNTKPAGNAGDIFLSGGSLLVGGGEVTASSSSEGMGGGIEIHAESMRLLNNGGVAAVAEGTGDAGNVGIDASGYVQMENGSIETKAVMADGGNIRISSGQLDAYDSQVTATVGGGEGDGGNVDMQYALAALNKSNITANAYEGRGGNILLAGDHLIVSSDTTISASSRFGVDGSVDIRSPEDDLISSLAALPEDFLDADQLLATPCESRTSADASTLYQAAREGMPAVFDDYLPSEADMGISDDTGAPVTVVQEGLERYHAGDFTGAIEMLEKARSFLDHDAAHFVNLTIIISRAYQYLGFPGTALQLMEALLPFNEERIEPRQQAVFYQVLSDLYLCDGRISSAKTAIASAMVHADSDGDAGLAVGITNARGNILLASGDSAGAMVTWQDALRQCEDLEHLNILPATVSYNLARLYASMGRHDESLFMLYRSVEYVSALPADYASASRLLAAGTTALRLAESLDEAIYPDAIRLAEDAFKGAFGILDQISNSRLQGYAYLLLGRLNVIKSGPFEAANLFRQAIGFAQRSFSPELEFEIYWQSARLMESQGSVHLGIRYYEKALAYLNQFKTEYFQGVRDRDYFFEKKHRLFYMQYVAYLLRLSRQAQGDKRSQSLLEKARLLVEALRQVELQNFFKDECVAEVQNKRININKIDRHAAILYSIVTQDALKLLLVLSEGVKAFDIPIKRGDLKHHAERFRRFLNPAFVTDKEGGDARFLSVSNQLYTYLVQPIEKTLTKFDIKTIVVAPDQLLAEIPYAALYDGTTFLVEKFAIARAPGIFLIDPKPVDWDNGKALVAGLANSPQGAQPLKYVPLELAAVKSLMGGRILQDADFTVARLTSELKSTQYSIIHLATHGYFSEFPEESYLLCYDQKLGMDSLAHFIGISKFRNTPVELLTLSACQTATGSVTAYYGMSGIALKSGARSALATLWPVEDEATYLLIENFYASLVKGMSRSQALRTAQRQLLHHSDYNPPFFWAGFVLIGSWL